MAERGRSRLRRAVQTQGEPSKRLAYAGFYRLLIRTAEIELPLDAGDFALMDRGRRRCIRSLPERSRFVRGLRAFVGFRQVGLEYDRPNRELGESKYPLSKLVRLAVDGLFDFSSFPIRLIGWGSVVMLLAASSLGVIASVNSSWPLGLMSVVLACTSVITMSLAIVGEYVRKIFVEVKARPTFLVKRIVNPQSEITT